MLSKLQQKLLPFIDIQAIENRFDNSINYKNLPSSISSRSSDEIAHAEQIEEAEQQEEVDQLLCIEKTTTFEPASPILWDGNYATIFQGQPKDHLLGIDIYHSPNFSHLSSNPHDSIHKFSYFYLAESSPEGLKVMALDLHDANLIINRIKTNSFNEHNYYLICGNKIVSHNQPCGEIDSIFISHDTEEIHKGLEPYSHQLSILSKILTGNPKISSKDRIYLSGLEPEKLLLVKEFVQKHERFWPNLKKLRGL